MMRPALSLALFLGLSQFAHARAVREPTVAKLFEYAPLVVTGKVTSITPLGIEMTLSYPTLTGVTFHWLRVTCEVNTVLKGKFPKKSIDVAMLAVKSGEGGLVNGPLMLSPATGQKYVMFLAPSSKRDVYVSLLAPYDERNAIFILDRKSDEYDFSHVVDGEYRKHCVEKKELVWSLVDEDGRFSEHGPRDIAVQYKSQIGKETKDFSIPLEWKKQTNAGGWSIDVPKDAPEPKRK